MTSPSGGRTPQGVRGLKFSQERRINGLLSRTPQGVRGLKFIALRAGRIYLESHPARGAWIEMAAALQTETANRVAPRKGCVD